MYTIMPSFSLTIKISHSDALNHIKLSNAYTEHCTV